MNRWSVVTLVALLVTGTLSWLILSPAPSSRAAADQVLTAALPEGWVDAPDVSGTLHRNRLGRCLTLSNEVACGGATRVMYAPDPTEQQMRSLLREAAGGGAVIGPADGCVEPPRSPTSNPPFCEMTSQPRPGFRIFRYPDLTGSGLQGEIPDGMSVVNLDGYLHVPDDGA